MTGSVKYLAGGVLGAHFIYCSMYESTVGIKSHNASSTLAKHVRHTRT